ncbi:MAG: PHP domain-containing protein, partial [Firmicutes bacterium]|nr:PHP domain-containing protein [Bacillota bacterium]
MFTHLHVHSEYSFMDGLPSLSLLAKRARALGMTALALTDHGNLYGAIEFYRLARAEGLKPILGCEVYLQREGKTANHSTFHLTLLAMNEEGYRNLLKLVSLANGYRSGDTGPGSPGSWPAGKGDAGQVGEALIGTAGSFSTPPKPGGVHNGSGYLRPTLPLTTTRELADHATGLIALSGCFQGEIPQALIGGEKQRARRLIRWYRAVFEDRFYLEVQDHGLTEEKVGNGYLVELAREEGVPLVATNNVHYLWPREAAAQRLALAIQRQQRNRPANPGTYTLPEYYLKSPQEMEERFLEIPEACTNTLVITERCNLELDLEGLHLPRFLGQDEKEEVLFLRQLALEGARVRYPTEPGGCPRRKVERTSSAPLYQEGGARKGPGQELSGPSPEPVEAVSHQVSSSLSTPVDTGSLQEGEVRCRLGDDFPASSLEPAPQKG